VVAITAQLGWIITVADHRPAFLTAQRFPEAHHLLLGRPEELAGAIQADERTAAVVMNHNYPHDRDMLRWFLRSAATYIGQLGPRRRTERLLAELQNESAETPLSAERLFAPVGLDIGCEAPEQIALAIVSEIQAHFAGKLPGRG
ncbi:MAG: XdhC family protein, partial [Terracidiphilus sp.]